MSYLFLFNRLIGKLLDVDVNEQLLVQRGGRRASSHITVSASTPIAIDLLQRTQRSLWATS